MLLDPKEQPAKDRSQRERGDGNSNQRDRRPDDKCMPLPRPEQSYQLKGMTPRRMEQSWTRHRQRSRIKQQRSGPQERQNQQELKGVYRMVGNL